MWAKDHEGKMRITVLLIKEEEPPVNVVREISSSLQTSWKLVLLFRLRRHLKKKCCVYF